MKEKEKMLLENRKSQTSEKSELLYKQMNDVHNRSLSLMKNLTLHEAINIKQSTKIRSNFTFVLIIFGVLIFMMILFLSISICCNVRIRILTEKLMDLRNKTLL